MTHDDAVVGKMATLFEPAPERWGLRGDPYLWQALRDHLADMDVPPSEETVGSLLYSAFDEATGVDLARTSDQSVYVERYAHGGMSSGHICLPFWRDQLVPLLMARAKALRTVRH